MQLLSGIPCAAGEEPVSILTPWWMHLACKLCHSGNLYGAGEPGASPCCIPVGLLSVIKSHLGVCTLMDWQFLPSVLPYVSFQDSSFYPVWIAPLDSILPSTILLHHILGTNPPYPSAVIGTSFLCVSCPAPGDGPVIPWPLPEPEIMSLLILHRFCGASAESGVLQQTWWGFWCICSALMFWCERWWAGGQIILWTFSPRQSLKSSSIIGIQDHRGICTPLTKLPCTLWCWALCSNKNVGGMGRFGCHILAASHISRPSKLSILLICPVLYFLFVSINSINFLPAFCHACKTDSKSSWKASLGEHWSLCCSRY